MRIDDERAEEFERLDSETPGCYQCAYQLARDAIADRADMKARIAELEAEAVSTKLAHDCGFNAGIIIQKNADKALLADAEKALEPLASFDVLKPFRPFWIDEAARVIARIRAVTEGRE